MNVTTWKTLNINITVEAFSHKGQQNTHECSYGGLAIYEKQGRKHEHLKTECVKDLYRISDETRCLSKTEDSKDVIFYFSNTATNQYRHPDDNHPMLQFSQSSSVLLIFYSYKEYSSMTIDVVVSTTECKVLTAYPCERFWLLLPWNDNCLILQIRHSQKHDYLYSRPSPSCFALWIQKFPLRKIMFLTGSGLLKGKITSLQICYNFLFSCCIHGAQTFNIAG